MKKNIVNMGVVRRRLKNTRPAGNLLQKHKGGAGLKHKGPCEKVHFDGPVYVLTSSATLSASTMFCKYLLKNENVTFVGSETMGATNYFWAHNHAILKLKNLNVKVNIPLEVVELKKGSVDHEQPERLNPDVKVTYSIEDLQSNKDKEIEWVEQQIDRINGKF